MSGLSRPSQRFINVYREELLEYREAAVAARNAVERVARDTGALLHVVSARAKTLESLRAKLRRKRYRRPEKDLTDLLGVRVITYYRDAVDPIVERLQQAFEIDEAKSTDKRLALGLRDFGYRSVHLIARLKSESLTRDSAALRDRWFEIQVRSILEHAWAEIEHEIVYKAGIQQPAEVLRRFAAMAGTLELLDNEFLALREDRNELIEGYRKEYEREEEFTRPFDVARLLAFLEAFRPGRSWRQAQAEGRPFGAGLDVSSVEAMKAVGLGTPSSLKRMFGSARFRYAVRTFAAGNGIAAGDVSHLASVVIALAVKKPRFVRQHFPEMIYDPSLRTMIDRRALRL